MDLLAGYDRRRCVRWWRGGSAGWRAGATHGAIGGDGLRTDPGVVGDAARAPAWAETFTKHVVVAQEENATEVGRDALRRGGSAVDAAVATAFALAVTHPSAGNLGGGGFLVAYDAPRHRVVTVDFRETAPQRVTPRLYLGPDGKPLPHHRAGARAAGVPGTVRGLALAHQKLGRLAWADLVLPAARLAREGFPVSATLAAFAQCPVIRSQES